MADSPTAILCFDFDGTLVDGPTDPYELARFEAYLGHMQKRGAVWGINTGRTLYHVLDGMREHGFQAVPDFIIARECELYHRNAVGRWVDLGEWNKRCAADHRKFYKAHASFFKKLKKHLGEHMESARFLSDETEPAGIVTLDDESMDQLCVWIDQQKKDWPELGYQRNSIWLRFTHLDYSKGTTLLELRRLLGIGPEMTFVAGDAHNDLSMLNLDVAHGIACPSNAIPYVVAHVRKAGGYTAAAPAVSGCLEAIIHYFYPDGE